MLFGLSPIFWGLGHLENANAADRVQRNMSTETTGDHYDRVFLFKLVASHCPNYDYPVAKFSYYPTQWVRVSPKARLSGHLAPPLQKVASEGFEPPKAVPADLQSDPFGHLGNSPGFR